MAMQNRRVWSRTLLRGESLIASVGLLGAALVIVTLGGAALWSMHAQRESKQAARRELVQAVGTLLAQESETLLRVGEVGSLRSSIAVAQASHGLSRVFVCLPDANSTLIADSAVVKVAKGELSTYPPLPDAGAWSAMPAGLDARTQSLRPDGSYEVRVPLNVPGRGPAILTLVDATTFPFAGDLQQQIGPAAIGIASLGGLLIAYRQIRRRMRALGAVREALVALDQGESSTQALMISPSLGSEAVSWNRLLHECEQLRERLAQEKAGERLGARKGRELDVGNVCDALWQGLVLIDDALCVKYVNGAGAVLLRSKRETLLGARADTALPPEAFAAVQACVSGEMRTRAVFEAGKPGDDTASVLRYSVRQVKKDGAVSALVCIEDITQQRIAEDSHRHFVASATHELRTPLTNIRLYADMLVEDEGLEPAKRAQALNVVNQEVRRLERIVHDMLSVAEIEAGQLKLNKDDVRLAPVFDDLRHDFEELAKQKEIRLSFDLPPKWPVLVGDRDKLVLALHNLVGNAVKYTPAGGEVTVRANEASGQFTVDVVDTGIGIKEEESQLIFDRFYRAKDRRIAGITGTGLGLSLAREVVRLHGGDISVKSQIDKGSTFTISLPLAA